MLIVSSFELQPLLTARSEGKTAAPTSADLGVSATEAMLDAEGALIAGIRVSWKTIEQIVQRDHNCFEITEADCLPVREYSDAQKKYYALYATGVAPTLLISGIPMHRIKNTDPWQDTEAKIAAAAPVTGRVLDTATGLGYTAILAAKTATAVYTIEIDPAASNVAKRNPYSRDLFDDARIERRFADTYDEILTFPAEHFDMILHDPPTLSLGGQLYSGVFYSRAYNVLRRGGRMFHYIGDPDSRTGAIATTGVRRRLLEAGFSRVVPKPEAFGVTAYK